MNGKTKARIYLDSNVFIHAFERSPLSAVLSRLFIWEPTRTPQRLVTSELTLSELLVKPIEMNRPDLITVYDNWTLSNPYIEVVPVVRDVLSDAAYLRAADKSLRLPDAIHLTTALGTSCRYFLTGDRRIRGKFGIDVVDLTFENVASLLEKQDD